jgi:hypothetical protein
MLCLYKTNGKGGEENVPRSCVEVSFPSIEGKYSSVRVLVID